MIKLHQEISRVSVLNSSELGETLPHSHEHSKGTPEDVERFRKFMSRISGRTVPIWAKAPAEPTIGIDNT